MPRRGRRNDSKRKARASEAIDHLSSILQSPENNDEESVNSAARDILRIGKRHGIRPDISTSRLICRGCNSALIPGRTSRTRIRSGTVIVTCSNCGRVTRRSTESRRGDSD
ncbi:MAG: hypothetical protein CMA47_00750 [Euryarchaeota archaeon]|nr:hypothetical protein [Euryarchaeota archaeon]